MTIEKDATEAAKTVRPEERQVPRQKAFELARENAHGKRNRDREEEFARFRCAVLPRMAKSMPHSDAEQNPACDEESARQMIINIQDTLRKKQGGARRQEHDRPRLEEAERPRRHTEEHPRADQQDGQENKHGGGLRAVCDRLLVRHVFYSPKTLKNGNLILYMLNPIFQGSGNRGMYFFRRPAARVRIFPEKYTKAGIKTLFTLAKRALTRYIM